MMRPPRWLLWTIFALLAWGLWAIVSKLIGDAVSAAQSQALSTLGILPVIVALGFSKRLSTIAHRHRGIGCAVGAGVLTCLGNVAYYDTLHRGAKAAVAVPLTALYPLVTVGLAVLLLKERLGRVQVVGVLLSLAAIYLFNVQRDEGFLSSALMYAFAPIALWGVSGFLQKLSTNQISGELSALWFLAAFIPVGLIILWREPLTGALPLKVWGLVALLGFFFAVGNYALLAAFASHGKASIIAPLAGLYPVVSVPIAILFLGEKIGPRETAGIVLALVSVAALSIEARPVLPEIAAVKAPLLK
jgi:drug/metabolite transporter (DMT)-like permease